MNHSSTYNNVERERAAEKRNLQDQGLEIPFPARTNRRGDTKRANVGVCEHSDVDTKKK